MYGRSLQIVCLVPPELVGELERGRHEERERGWHPRPDASGPFHFSSLLCGENDATRAVILVRQDWSWLVRIKMPALLWKVDKKSQTKVQLANEQ